MLGTGSWGKELAGGSIDIDFNLLSGSWEVVWLACLAVEAGCGERVCFVRVFVVFLLKRFIEAV